MLAARSNKRMGGRHKFCPFHKRPLVHLIRGANAAPLARGQPREGEEPIAGFLQAVDDSFVLEPPFAHEGLASCRDLLAGRRVDHIVVVGGDLLVQALGRVGQEVAMLVDRAALDRQAVPHRGDRGLEPGRAVDDQELGPPQAAGNEIVEYRAPGGKPPVKLSITHNFCAKSCPELYVRQT
jgi:hypothetical protein